MHGSLLGDSELDNAQMSDIILWPALLAEMNGLLRCMESDYEARCRRIATAIADCSTPESAKHSCIYWRAIGYTVRWQPTMDMVKNILSIL